MKKILEYLLQALKEIEDQLELQVQLVHRENKVLLVLLVQMVILLLLLLELQEIG